MATQEQSRSHVKSPSHGPCETRSLTPAHDRGDNGLCPVTLRRLKCPHRPHWLEARRPDGTSQALAVQRCPGRAGGDAPTHTPWRHVSHEHLTGHRGPPQDDKAFGGQYSKPRVRRRHGQVSQQRGAPARAGVRAPQKVKGLKASGAYGTGAVSSESPAGVCRAGQCKSYTM